MSDNIGIIGLGLLGSALASRLLKAGFDVTGYDIDRQTLASFVDGGGVAAESPQTIAREKEHIILSLPSSSLVDQVLNEMETELRAGQIIIDTTTGSPNEMAAFGDRLLKRNVQYLDATIAGSSEQARQGEVIAMVGGNTECFQNVKPFLETFAREIVHVGPCGSGARMKLVVNLVLGLNRAVLAEGLAFAKTMGCNAQSALEILQAGPAFSRVMETKGEKMLTGNFEPQARLSQHLKDVRLILENAQTASLDLPLSQLHEQLLERAEAAGLGALDNSAISRIYDSITKPSTE